MCYIYTYISNDNKEEVMMNIREAWRGLVIWYNKCKKKKKKFKVYTLPWPLNRRVDNNSRMIYRNCWVEPVHTYKPDPIHIRLRHDSSDGSHWPSYPVHLTALRVSPRHDPPGRFFRLPFYILPLSITHYLRSSNFYIYIQVLYV